MSACRGYAVHPLAIAIEGRPLPPNIPVRLSGLANCDRSENQHREQKPMACHAGSSPPPARRPMIDWGRFSKKLDRVLAQNQPGAAAGSMFECFIKPAVTPMPQSRMWYRKGRVRYFAGVGWSGLARSKRQGLAGSVQGIREIADRLDGKVPQAIAGIDEHENLTPLTAVINLGRTQPQPAPKTVGGVRKRSDGDPVRPDRRCGPLPGDNP
jgi:hypothetical protein